MTHRYEDSIKSGKMEQQFGLRIFLYKRWNTDQYMVLKNLSKIRDWYLGKSVGIDETNEGG